MQNHVIITLLLTWFALEPSWNLPIHQIPGQPREPFQYWLPVATFHNGSSEDTGNNSTSHKHLFLGEPLIASANSINPIGFDFMKLLVVKRPLHVQTKIVPLVWVDLPLFDTPTFGNLQPSSSSQTHKDQKSISNSTSVRAHTGDTSTPVYNGRDTPSQKLELPERATSLPGRNSLDRSEKALLPTYTLVNQKDQLKNSSQDVHKINWSSLLHYTTTSDSGESVSVPIRKGENPPTKSDPLVSESRNQETRRATQHFQESTQNSKLSPSSPEPRKQQSQEPQDVSHTPASYNFSYEVSDQETKDVKSHKESRQGDVVQGEYSVLEPDGYTRVVTYTADADGFKAIVKRVPPK